MEFFFFFKKSWGKFLEENQEFFVLLILRCLFISVQFSQSVMSNSLQPHGLQHARPPCPSPTPSLLKLMSTELVMPCNHLLLCHPLLLLCSVFPSIRVFSNESVLQVAKVLEFWRTDLGAYLYSQEKILRYTSLGFNRQNSTVVKHLRILSGVKQQNKTKVKFQEWLWYIKKKHPLEFKEEWCPIHHRYILFI